MMPGDSTAHHEMPDGCFGDDQQQADQPEQEPERLGETSANAREARDAVHQRGLPREVHRAAIARQVPWSYGLEHLRPHHAKRCVCLLQRHALGAPPHDVQPGFCRALENVLVVGHKPRHERRRHGQVGREARRDAEEPAGRDAHDGDRHPLEANRTADDAGISAEPLLPAVIANHGHFGSAVVEGLECPAERGGDAERVVYRAGRSHDIGGDYV